jgi:hypothetical protein
MKRKLAVVYRQIDALIPYVGNSRTHSDEQVAQIAASIREFGFTNPILTDGENGIIAGHGRLMAARKLAMDEVPTIELAGLTAAQKRAYVIADNKLALNAGWDMATLANEFHALNEAGFDLGLTGFSLGEIDEMLSPDDGDDDEPGNPESGGAGSLAAKFGIPPFSVLNAREGWWQDRKRAWLAIGIQSELGRGEQLIPNGGGLGSKERYDTRGGATLGAIAPNEATILMRSGKYATPRRAGR